MVYLNTLKYAGENLQTIDSVIKYMTGLQQETRALYSELIKLLCIFLLFPGASCTPVRSFSALTRVKTYLRSTMGQERLNSCCILNTYKEMADNLKIIEILKEFVQNDNRLKTFRKIL